MNTVLFFGGRSDERLVSVASSQNLAAQFNFDELWYFHPSGEIAKASASELKSHERPFERDFMPTEKPFAVSLAAALKSLSGKTIFLGFHGDEGEDGQIQAQLEEARIAFTGSGSRSSADCFDKKLAKAGVAEQVPTAEGIEVGPDSINQLRAFYQRHKKIVVKPIASGSSFGLFIVTSDAKFEEAVAGIKALRYGRFLAEEFLEGRELTVGVWHDKVALPPSEVIMNHGRVFDYEGKYLGKGSLEVTPAKITADDTAAAQDLAMKAHRALGCYGYSRTDMMLTSRGPVFIETNTLPGMTKASFFPQQLDAANLQMRKFIEAQMEFARRRYD